MVECRECGCTEDNACIVNSVPCHWVADDLCSACVVSWLYARRKKSTSDDHSQKRSRNCWADLEQGADNQRSIDLYRQWQQGESAQACWDEYASQRQRQKGLKCM